MIMGIGEPFENYDASVQFMRVIQDEKGLNLAQRRITVSTSGIVPSIYRFAEEGLQVGLAISFTHPTRH